MFTAIRLSLDNTANKYIFSPKMINHAVITSLNNILSQNNYVIILHSSMIYKQHHLNSNITNIT